MEHRREATPVSPAYVYSQLEWGQTHWSQNHKHFPGNMDLKATRTVAQTNFPPLGITTGRGQSCFATKSRKRAVILVAERRSHLESPSTSVLVHGHCLPLSHQDFLPRFLQQLLRLQLPYFPRARTQSYTLKVHKGTWSPQDEVKIPQPNTPTYNTHPPLPLPPHLTLLPH